MPRGVEQDQCWAVPTWSNRGSKVAHLVDISKNVLTSTNATVPIPTPRFQHVASPVQLHFPSHPPSSNKSSSRAMEDLLAFLLK